MISSKVRVPLSPNPNICRQTDLQTERQLDRQTTRQKDPSTHTQRISHGRTKHSPGGCGVIVQKRGISFRSPWRLTHPRPVALQRGLNSRSFRWRQARPRLKVVLAKRARRFLRCPRERGAFAPIALRRVRSPGLRRNPVRWLAMGSRISARKRDGWLIRWGREASRQ